MKKINSEKLVKMAKDPLNYKFIIICCELYHAPCIDWLYRIEEHFLKNKAQNPKIQIWWLDTQYNDIIHAKFNADTQEKYESVGIFYKEGKNIKNG